MLILQHVDSIFHIVIAQLEAFTDSDIGLKCQLTYRHSKHLVLGTHQVCTDHPFPELI